MDRKKEIAFNLSIMKEMGLEEGDRRRVIDQDTGEMCCFGNKEIITPGSQSGKNSVELDLLNNSRMMNKLFMEFLDKIEEEEEIESPAVSFGSYENKGTGRIKARVIFDNGDFMESKPYLNENLCYVELIHRINGEDQDNIDLSEFDEERKRTNDKNVGSIKPKKDRK